MDEGEYLLTEAGAQKLHRQLDELRGPRRQELAARLRRAIQQGDLTENADYIAAKEEQGFLEGKIQELEEILRNATIVQNDASEGVISIGSTVVVSEGKNESEIFHLVGVKEADPRQRKISHLSPIGKALLGKRAGDIAVAHTPSGERKLKIHQVR